jgi:hypothetical protein
VSHAFRFAPGVTCRRLPGVTKLASGEYQSLGPGSRTSRRPSTSRQPRALSRWSAGSTSPWKPAGSLSSGEYQSLGPGHGLDEVVATRAALIRHVAERFDPEGVAHRRAGQDHHPPLRRLRHQRVRDRPRTRWSAGGDPVRLAGEPRLPVRPGSDLPAPAGRDQARLRRPVERWQHLAVEARRLLVDEEEVGVEALGDVADQGGWRRRRSGGW